MEQTYFSTPVDPGRLPHNRTLATPLAVGLKEQWLSFSAPLQAVAEMAVDLLRTETDPHLGQWSRKLVKILVYRAQLAPGRPPEFSLFVAPGGMVDAGVRARPDAASTLNVAQNVL